MKVMVKFRLLSVLFCLTLTACASMGDYGVKVGTVSDRQDAPLNGSTQSEDQGYIAPTPSDAAPISVDANSSESIVLLANNRFPIMLPWPNGGIASSADLRGITFTMTECKRQTGLVTSFLNDEFLENHRTVHAIVPRGINLLQARLANTVLVQSLHEAWAKCPFTSKGRPLFSGVYIEVMQDAQTAITAGRTKGPYSEDGKIWFGEVKHVLYQQTQKTERERQLAAERAASQAASEKAWASWWFKVRIGFFAIVSAAALWFGAKYVPPILTRIAWFFFPHPAIAELKHSMRRGASQPVDGDRLADAFNFKPRNSTEAELAKRDIEDLTKSVQSEREYQHAEEELARTVIETERARQRVEELKKYKGHFT